MNTAIFKAILTVLVIAALLITSSVSMQEDAFAADTKSASGSKPATIIWCMPGKAQSDTGLVESGINSYIKDKLNIQVKFNLIGWGDYPYKLKSMHYAGEAFDIAYSSAVYDYVANSKEGLYLPLNGLIEKLMPKTVALLGKDTLNGARVDNVLYGIPPINGSLATGSGLMLKKEVVKKYFIDVNKIKSLKDLEPIFKSLKGKLKDMKMFAKESNDSFYKLLNYDDLSNTYAPGVIYNNDKNMKVFNEFEKAETKEYFKTLYNFQKVGYLYMNKINDTSDNIYNYESQGKTFALLTNSLYPYNIFNNDWERIYLSKIYRTTAASRTYLHAIYSASKNPEKALSFLELVNTDKKLSNMVGFGIEGRHYVKKNESVISVPKGKQYGRVGYEQNYWIKGNVFLNYIWDIEDVNKNTKINDFLKKAVPSQTLGFAFDDTLYKDEIAECMKIKNEYLPKLENGEIDPDKAFPELIKKLKAADVDLIIKAKQYQLDEWRKTQK